MQSNHQACTSCGMPLGIGDAFCENCGQKVIDPMFPSSAILHKSAVSLPSDLCNNCRVAIIPGNSFCENCGQRFGSDLSEIPSYTPTQTISPQRTPAYIPPIATASLQHSQPSLARMPLLFLLNTSTNSYINHLSDSLNQFKQNACCDSHVIASLDLSIIQFGDTVSVTQGFSPVRQVNPVMLVPDRNANYSNAISESLKVIDNYINTTPNMYKPWIILISGTVPTDNIDAIANEIQYTQNADKLRFMALSIGGHNVDALKQLTDIVFRIDDTNFTAFFSWLNKCMQVITQTTPCKKPQLPPLEGNVYRDGRR